MWYRPTSGQRAMKGFRQDFIPCENAPECKPTETERTSNKQSYSERGLVKIFHDGKGPFVKPRGVRLYCKACHEYGHPNQRIGAGDTHRQAKGPKEKQPLGPLPVTFNSDSIIHTTVRVKGY